MTYATLLEREGINSQYLVIMKPRRLIPDDGWTVVTGTVYRQQFTLGEIVAVLDDGSSLTMAASVSVGSNEFYYDPDTFYLYVDVGEDPSSHQIIGTYEIHLATFDAHWFRDPLDDETRVVYYEPLITRSPSITNSTSDLLFGFLPTYNGSITVGNLTNFLQEHVYESSFNLCDILIYHYLDELTVANTKLVLRGYCKEITADDNSIGFSVLDATSFFDKQYRNAVGPSFYSTTLFGSLDLNYLGRPMRQVFGVVEGFVPVNVDFNSDTPTTSNNRYWVCVAGHSNLGTISTTVKASPASTNTRTYLTSVSGFRIGDTFWNKTATTKYGIITAVGADYIDHSTLTANSSGDVIERSFIGNVQIVKNERVYTAWYGRDYIEYTYAPDSYAGFQFNTSMETNLNIHLLDPPTLTPSDIVFCRIYGHKLQETIGGVGFGSNSTTTGNITAGPVILYHLLKTCLGLPESDLNTTSFSAINGAISDQIGFAIPKNVGEDFPSYKDLILQICQTLLLKFFLDFDGKWKVSQTGPLGTADKEIAADEILSGTFSYNFSYQDIISRVLVEYNARQVNDVGQMAGDSASTVSSESDVAKYLHNVEQQKTFHSLHFLEADAQVLADRLKFALGDRRGKCRISTKNRFFDTELDHVITVSRTRMPGVAYDEDVERTREFAVISTAKSLSEINIELDDQKGIEDNQGDW